MLTEEIKEELMKTLKDIHYYFYIDYKPLVDKIIETNNINVRDENESTILIRAARFNFTKLVSLLIQSGADISARDDNTHTALTSATFFNCIESVKILLEAGADVNAQLESGRTALHIAAYQNNVEVAKLLIEYGADIEACDLYDKKPMDYAVSNAYVEIIKLLDNAKQIREEYLKMQKEKELLEKIEEDKNKTEEEIVEELKSELIRVLK